jgi:hypothetical protein
MAGAGSPTGVLRSGSPPPQGQGCRRPLRDPGTISRHGPLLCERKHGLRVTSGDAGSVPPTLAFAVVACRLLLPGCRAFAACSPPAGPGRPFVRNDLGTVEEDRLKCVPLCPRRDELRSMGAASLQHPSNLAGTDADGRGAGKGRIVGWLAWLPWVICLALAGLAIVFAVKRGRPPGELVADMLPTVTWTIAFSLVGAVVAYRRPRHRLGWIFCVVGLSQGLVAFTNEYALYALWTAPGSVPGGPFMAWLTTWDWAGSAPVLLTFVPLLFPDGRLRRGAGGRSRGCLPFRSRCSAARSRSCTGRCAALRSLSPEPSPRPRQAHWPCSPRKRLEPRVAQDGN